MRTLHHYDGIGLVTPSTRSAAGYRLYSASDLHRLRQVLFYRELEFGLDEIAEILADPPRPFRFRRPSEHAGRLKGSPVRRTVQ